MRRPALGLGAAMVVVVVVVVLCLVSIAPQVSARLVTIDHPMDHLTLGYMGTYDESDVTGDLTWPAGHAFGESITGCDVDGDGIDEIVLGSHINAGAIGILRTTTTAAPVELNQTRWLTQANHPDLFSGNFGLGSSVVCYGNYAADPVGLARIVGGAPLTFLGGAYRLMTLNATAQVVNHETLDRTNLTNINLFDEVGTAASLIGDLDGNGFEDLALVCAKDGRIWIVRMEAGWRVGGYELLDVGGTSAPGMTFLPSDEIVSVASAGDQDGDGILDIVIGAQAANSNGGIAVCFLNALYGVRECQVTLGSADIDGLLATPGSLFGKALADVGDLDGDGRHEVMVSATALDGYTTVDEGGMFLLSFHPNGSLAWSRSFYDGVNGVDMNGEFGVRFGTGVALLRGDRDGDGSPELAVGVGDHANGQFQLYNFPRFVANASMVGDDGNATDGLFTIVYNTVRPVNVSLVVAVSVGGLDNVIAYVEVFVPYLPDNVTIDTRSLGVGVQMPPGHALANLTLYDVAGLPTEVAFVPGSITAQASICFEPAPPTSVAAVTNPEGTTVLFSWVAPVHFGGCDSETGYRITLSINGSPAADFDVDGIYLNLPVGVSVGDSLVFTIRSLNSALIPSAPSPELEVLVVSVPSPPRNLNVVCSLLSHVKIVFDAPSSDGGSPIMGYEAARDGSVVPVGSSRVLDASLAPAVGTTYIYSVTAINSVGPSEPALISVTVVDPAPATGLVVFFDEAAGGLVVNWLPGSTCDTASFSQQAVVSMDAAFSAVIATGPASPSYVDGWICPLAGLVASPSYFVHVESTFNTLNRVSSSLTVSGALPSAPPFVSIAVLNVTASPPRAQLVWAIPNLPFGAVYVNEYAIEAGPNSGTLGAPVAPDAVSAGVLPATGNCTWWVTLTGLVNSTGAGDSVCVRVGSVSFLDAAAAAWTGVECVTIPSWTTPPPAPSSPPGTTPPPGPPSPPGPSPSSPPPSTLAPTTTTTTTTTTTSPPSLPGTTTEAPAAAVPLPPPVVNVTLGSQPSLVVSWTLPPNHVDGVFVYLVVWGTSHGSEKVPIGSRQANITGVAAGGRVSMEVGPAYSGSIFFAAVTTAVAGGGAVSAATEAAVYVAWPSLLAFEPHAYSPLGGDVLTAIGTRFMPEARVTVGGVPAVSLFVSDKRLLVTFPARSGPGYVDVTVTNPNGGTVTWVGAVYYTAAGCVTEGFFVDADGNCVDCPDNAVCPGGGRAWPLPGYWSPNETSGDITACNPMASCLGGQTSGCASGYSGFLCSACADGYYFEDSRCNACDSPAVDVSLRVLDFVMVAILIMVIVAAPRPVVRRVSFWLTVVQVIRVIGSTSAGAMPHEFSLTMRGLALATGEGTRQATSCGPVGGGFYAQFSAQLVVLYGAGALTVVVTLVGWAAAAGLNRVRACRSATVNKRSRSQSRWWLDRMIDGAVVFGVFSHSTVVSLTLRTMACVTVAGERRLVADPTMVCWEGEHLTMFAIGLSLLLVHGIGLPAGLSLILARHKHVLHTNGSVKNRYGSLYELFQRSETYFMITWMGYVMLMLLVLRTLRSSQMAVFGLAGIFTLGFAAYTSIRRPFLTTIWNLTFSTVILTCLLSAVVLLVSANDLTAVAERLDATSSLASASSAAAADPTEVSMAVAVLSVGIIVLVALVVLLFCVNVGRPVDPEAALVALIPRDLGGGGRQRGLVFMYPSEDDSYSPSPSMSDWDWFARPPATRANRSQSEGSRASVSEAYMLPHQRDVTIGSGSDDWSVDDDPAAAAAEAEFARAEQLRSDSRAMLLALDPEGQRQVSKHVRVLEAVRDKAGTARTRDGQGQELASFSTDVGGSSASSNGGAMSNQARTRTSRGSASSPEDDNKRGDGHRPERSPSPSRPPPAMHNKHVMRHSTRRRSSKGRSRGSSKGSSKGSRGSSNERRSASAAATASGSSAAS